VGGDGEAGTSGWSDAGHLD